MDSPEPCIAAADHIRRNAPLAIRRASQRNQLPLPRDPVLYLDCIPNRPDMRIARLHLVVDMDSSAFSYLQPCAARQLCLWPHADGKYHKLRVKRRSALRANDQAAIGALLKPHNTLAQHEIYSVRLQALPRILGHLGIERRHHLLCELDDGHGDAAMLQILCHL